MKSKTDKEKRNKKSNKTCLLRVRCSEEEKVRIQKRAERTGKKLSEFCREALLTGEIIAVPQLGEHEREAIRVLQRVSYFFCHISNLIKTPPPLGFPLPRTSLVFHYTHSSDFTALGIGLRTRYMMF